MIGRKILLIIGGSILFGLLTFIVFFRQVDYTPLTQQHYYRTALQQTDGHNFSSVKGEIFKVGWNKQNITPEQPAHLMGYGWKGDYQQVHDSLWVRTFAFQLDTLTIGLVSYDLMLTPPLVAQQVQAAASDLGLDYVYFSATHTHKGYGSWEQGFGRELITGWYDSSLVNLLINKTVLSLQKAYQQLLPSELAYAQFDADTLVNNRLVKGGDTEPYLRAVYFQRQDSSRAILSSFSAHATLVTSKSKQLSGDYPSSLVSLLEKDSSIDFALFAAGAVGSHSPHKPGPFSFQKLQTYASHLASPLLRAIDTLTYDSVSQLSFGNMVLPLGEPQFRISDNWRLRPFWFRKIMGQHSPAISFLQLGKIQLVGTPGDFSGLLYNRIKSGESPLIVTSFNGEYIGYLIPSEHYHLNHREARSINWYGPYTGDYTVEMINNIYNK